jgi:hypothetical protein
MLLHLLLECIGLTAKHFFFIQTKRRKKNRENICGFKMDLGMRGEEMKWGRKET